MEKHTLVRNEGLRLPPGYRFLPTDEELVVQYLKAKVLAHPLPTLIFPQLNVCKHDPWILPGDSKEVRCFFSSSSGREVNGNRSNTSTPSGFWTPIGICKQILDSRRNQVVGLRKTLTFCMGKPESMIETEWVLNEYRLVEPETTQNSMMQMGDWVLSCVFLRRRRTKNDGEIVQPWEENGVQNIVLVRRTSSASSGVTEDSDIESDLEQSNS